LPVALLLDLLLHPSKPFRQPKWHRDGPQRTVDGCTPMPM
jgi:hypothetical protein